MKARKFFFNVLLLAIFAAVVFFIGWIQFLVKPGTVGVMESKTSGLYESPILPGEFAWRWERLLPTNVTMHVFDLTPYQSKQTVSGDLPSASIYRAQLEPSPDFSYRIECEVSLSASPDALVTLVKNHSVSDTTELHSLLGTKAAVIAHFTAEYLIEHNSARNVLPSSLSKNEIEEVLALAGDGLEGIVVDEIKLSSVRIPDYELYQTAKDSYTAYQERVKALLMEKASEQASTLAEEDRTMAQLEKFGELLSKYPQLEELSKQGSITDIISVLRSSL